MADDALIEALSDLAPGDCADLVTSERGRLTVSVSEEAFDQDGLAGCGYRTLTMQVLDDDRVVTVRTRYQQGPDETTLDLAVIGPGGDADPADREYVDIERIEASTQQTLTTGETA